MICKESRKTGEEKTHRYTPPYLSAQRLSVAAGERPSSGP